ncbi:tenascin-N isoform X1 [Erythrolamprus reginae]|uniref:tenascin-N isoform X1 n=1 Tax=Erythrolamprus reginae TaxID=121349 RepID=UPI00396CFA4C
MAMWFVFLGIMMHCSFLEVLTQLPVQPENCSDQSQKISFSHSYKINVPESFQFKAEPDPGPLQDNNHMFFTNGEVEEGEEQNIIFRHNIRLQTPKRDCELLHQVKALLERVGNLELEVVQLKRICNPQKCCGKGKGVSSCSGHGTFIEEICSCNCEEGWEGQDCSQPTCPGNCNSNGRCIDGRCVCNARYAGDDCSQLLCPENCSGNGVCVHGVCQCYQEFTGDDCSEKRCPNDCSGNGYCDSGECYCKDGFTELDCSKVVAPWNARLLKTTENSLAIGWDKITDVDYYLISYFPLGEEALMKQIQVPKDQTNYEIRGLIPGTEYVITLRNVKKEVFSEPELLQGSTAVSAIGLIWVTEETENSLEVEWENPAAEVDYYKLRFGSLSGEEKEVIVPKSNDVKSRYIITGLKPGTKYKITVISVRNEVDGKPSSVHGWTDIDGPTHLVTDRVTENTATISWNGAQAPVDGYVVSYNLAGGDTRQISIDKDKRTTTLVGLKPGMKYTIHIWAVKGTQQSRRASTEAETDIDGPTHLVTDRVTENTATISWNGAQAPIDGYVVSYNLAGGDTRQISIDKDKRTTTLVGLKPGMKYTIHIWAVKGTQQSRRASTEAETEIDGPTNLKTDQVTENSATVSWNKAWAPIEQNILSYTSADGETREVPVGKDNIKTTLTNLKPGMEYVLHIWAVKGSQQSKRASTKTMTDIDPPKNIRVSDVTQSSALVTWMPPDAEISGYLLSYQPPVGTSKEVQLGANDQKFVLENLRRGTKYTIYVTAFKGDRRSQTVATTFSTISLNYPYPEDCSQIRQNGNSISGLYTIYLNGDSNRPFEVYCDMTTDGGGWIMIQRRSTGQLDFSKKWKNYIEGFGSSSGEFWLGLEKLHNLTKSARLPYELRVDLRTHNESAYATYDFFQVGSSRDRYKLSLGNYRGTAGDAMTYHNGRKFTTIDKDNDIAITNCAMTHHGGWWYKNCHLANLNGKYGEHKHSEGINWEPWKGHLYSIPYTEMKIRPRSHSFEAVLSRKRRSLVVKRKEAKV